MIKLMRVVKEKLSAEEISTTDALIAGGLVVGAALWVGFASRVVPNLIRAAVKGESYAPLNDFISEPKPKAAVKTESERLNDVISYRHPDYESYFLARWNDVAATGLLIWACFGLLMWRPTRTYFAEHHVGTATPGTLGAMRVFVCLVAVFMLLYDEPIEEVGSWLGVRRRKMGVMPLFYRVPIIDKVTKDRPTALKFKALTIGVLLVGAVGWQTRVVLPLATVLYLIAQGIVRSYTYFNHAGMIPFHMLAVLSCTRSADRWSLDHWIRVRRGTSPENQVANRPEAHYAWARLALWVVLALPYWKSGMSKLRFGSWHWWKSVNMRATFFKYRLSWAEVVEESVPKRFILLPDWFYSLMGLCTIVTEVGMIFAPISQRARLILPVGAAGLHLGIWGIMGIEFWDMFFLQAIFYDWGARSNDPSTLRPFDKLRGVQAQGGPGSGHPRTTEVVTTSLDWRAPFAIFLLTAFHFGWWALRIESYPFSSWQIFHRDSHSGVFKYVKAYKTDKNGQRTPAYLWKMGRPSRDHAVLLILHFTRTEEYTYISDVLRQIGARWNANAKPGERLTKLELVEFEWDFVNNRHDCKGQPVKQLAITFGND